jgi:hypothetical protein
MDSGNALKFLDDLYWSNEVFSVTFSQALFSLQPFCISQEWHPELVYLQQEVRVDFDCLLLLSVVSCQLSEEGGLKSEV